MFKSLTMKIMQINTVAVNGSTGRIAEAIGKAAIKAGHESYIAYGRGDPGTSASQLIKIGDKCSVYEHVIATRLFDRQGLESRRATKQFLKHLDTIKPDIIHLHNLHGSYINYDILFSYLSKKRIPVVWTLHDCWPFTGHCVHYTAVECNRWMTGCHNCPRLKSYPKSLYTDRSCANYLDKKRSFLQLDNMIIVAVSNWLAEVIKRSFLNKYPIGVIHNGIDTDAFYPRQKSIGKIRKKYGLSDKFLVLGVATGWSNENGLYEFIELSRRLDSKRFKVMLVGVDDKVKKLLPEDLLGIGRTDSQEELAELYTTSDIFINGSFEETFGLVTVEAMACGTKVIVFDSTACPEVVNDNAGYIVERHDIDAIVEIINKEAQNQETDNSNSFKISDYARKNFDHKNMAKEYIRVYDEIYRQNH